MAVILPYKPPRLYPGLDKCAGFFLRAGSRGAAETRRPRPADQGVGTDVMDQVFDFSSAVADGILDLSANLGERFAFPRHLARREVPFRVTRHAAGLEVGALVPRYASNISAGLVSGPSRASVVM